MSTAMAMPFHVLQFLKWLVQIKKRFFTLGCAVRND